jgi:3'-phosphoadenosine 5'-phosphosulfate sulfotransferase (PAPS reductase)/FAD synthetase
VRSVDDSIRAAASACTPDESRNRHQSVTLLDTIAEHGFDACIGGARRDEEKARAKERVFSFRDEFGQWDPKNQRPNSGASTTPACTRARTCACSRSATGPSSMCGSTSSARSSPCRTSTTRTNARSSVAAARCCR